jgi:hypothetical protein
MPGKRSRSRSKSRVQKRKRSASRSKSRRIVKRKSSKIVKYHKLAKKGAPSRRQLLIRIVRIGLAKKKTSKSRPISKLLKTLALWALYAKQQNPLLATRFIKDAKFAKKKYSELQKLKKKATVGGKRRKTRSKSKARSKSRKSRKGKKSSRRGKKSAK